MDRSLANTEEFLDLPNDISLNKKNSAGKEGFY